MSAVTPELALIDPELAAAARALLPEPGAFCPAWSAERAREAPEPVVEARLAVPPGAASRSGRVRRRAVLAAVGALSGVAAAVALTVTLAASPGSNTGAVATGVTAVVPLGAAAREKAEGRTYSWPSVPGARAYRVVIRRDRQPVYEATTTRSTLELPASLGFSPGRYTWSATPLRGGSSPESDARPVVEGTFVIPV